MNCLIGLYNATLITAAIAAIFFGVTCDPMFLLIVPMALFSLRTSKPTIAQDPGVAQDVAQHNDR